MNIPDSEILGIIVRTDCGHEHRENLIIKAGDAR
jgi:hypothetical protein